MSSAMIAICHFSLETKEQAKTIKKLQAYYEYQIKVYIKFTKDFKIALLRLKRYNYLCR